MDKVTGNEPTDDNTIGDDPVVAPIHPHASHNQEDSEQPAENNDRSQKHIHTHPQRRMPSWFLGYLRKLRDAGPDRHIELAIAAAVLIMVWCQYDLARRNNKSTGEQVDKIISATGGMQSSATEMKNAAWQFKGSAEGIDGNLGNAVVQLGGQIKEAEISRRSSEAQSVSALNTATANARADLRAYITVSLSPQQIDMGCGPGIAPRPCTRFQYVNVGKTPAVAVRVVAYLRQESPWGGERFVEKELKEMLTVTQYTGIEGGVVSNSSPETGQAIEDSNDAFFPCQDAYHGSVCGHSIYGIIQYKDIFGETHETGFCMHFVEHGPETNHYCAYGNWFDNRPNGYPQRQDASRKTK